MSFIATTDMYIEMRNKRDLAEDKLHDMTKQRDTLIDDIKKLRERNKQLEENNEQLNEIFNYQENKKKEYFNDIAVLRANNKRLELENNGLKLDLDSLDALISEVSLNATRYDVLTEHIRQKAEANPNVDRYIALVNYIDRLERE